MYHELAAPLQWNHLSVLHVHLELLVAEAVGIGLRHILYVRLNNQVYLTKLSCTTRLLLVAIVGTGCLGDCLTIWNLRLLEVDHEFLVVLDAPLECTQVELTLSFHDSLLQLLRLLNNPSGIFTVHTSEDFAELLGIGLILRLDGTRIFRLGIFDEIEYILTTLVVKSVACLHVLHLNCCTYISCNELINRSLDLSAHAVYLCQTLAVAFCHICEVGSCTECSRHHLEIRYFTNVWLNGCLEHHEAERSVCIGLHLCSVGCARCRHLIDKWYHVAKELHHAANTHILQCAHAEYRIDTAVNESLADSFTHLVLCE